MKKCILKVYETNKAEIRGGVIRIDDKAAKKLMQIQIETGLSIKSIASTFIKFAAEDYEVKVVKPGKLEEEDDE